MYIDGVFSGGGIRGFALIGAYQALEEKGIQFEQLAGTSAGSLIAAFIKAGYTSHEIIDIMDNLDLGTFLDARKTAIPIPFAKWLFLYWRLGLYKGAALEEWIENVLAAKGVRTFADLPPQSLKLIASNLTTGTMITLPDDLPKFGINPMTFSVAKAVRMSCSLPYFFEPVKLRPPTGCYYIVDGGVLSNFPIWLFEKYMTRQKRPVLGIKLSGNTLYQPVNKVDNAVNLFTALFETMMKAHDIRYISRRHEKNIVFIPVEGGLTTEFGLSIEKKRELIGIGKKKTQQFLKTWNY